MLLRRRRQQRLNASFGLGNLLTFRILQICLYFISDCTFQVHCSLRSTWILLLNNLTPRHRVGLYNEFQPLNRKSVHDSLLLKNAC
jgi:hypothetical protein